MTIYEVKLSWFDWETETSEREDESYFFTDAADALNFGRNLSWNKGAYSRYKRPLEAYLYSFEEWEAVTEDRRYDVAWHELDKKVRL